jgi:hypothetical protein
MDIFELSNKNKNNFNPNAQKFLYSGKSSVKIEVINKKKMPPLIKRNKTNKEINNLNFNQKISINNCNKIDKITIKNEEKYFKKDEEKYIEKDEEKYYEEDEEKYSEEDKKYLELSYTLAVECFNFLDI